MSSSVSEDIRVNEWMNDKKDTEEEEVLSYTYNKIIRGLLNILEWIFKFKEEHITNSKVQKY